MSAIPQPLAVPAIPSSVSSIGRAVILHADDFGMNSAINRGIVRGFTHGLLTATSMLANAPACDDAVSAWRTHLAGYPAGDFPSASRRRLLGDVSSPFELGIHLNLTQGWPLTANRYPSQLLDREGRFPGIFALFRRLSLARAKYRDAIRAELSTQIERLLDHGFNPTHLNGHQYVEMLPVVSAVIPDLLARYRIPALRVAWETHLTRTLLGKDFQVAGWCLAQVKRCFALRLLLRANRLGIRHADRYFGTAHAGRIDLELMRVFVTAQPFGTIEIGLHPGTAPAPDAAAVNDSWSDPLAHLRPGELALLESPELAELFAAHGVRLSRFAHLGRASL